MDPSLFPPEFTIPEAEEVNAKFLITCSYNTFILLPQIIKRANAGSLVDLITVAKGLFPPSLHQSIFEMAFYHIEKNKPPIGDHSQKTWQLGKLVSVSMWAILSVCHSVSMNEDNNLRLWMLWPQTFEWLQYLRRSIDHLHTHVTGDNVESLCGNYAFRISRFIHAAAKFPLVRKYCLRDLDVVKFIADWWASATATTRDTDEATHAMAALNVLLDDEGGASLLSSTLLTSFGSAENIARFAIGNAHNALRGRNVGTVMSGSHFAVLRLLLNMKGTISEAVLAKGVVPLLLKTMGVLIDLPLYRRATILGLALGSQASR